VADLRFARCDYCGAIFPCGRTVLYWVNTDTLDDGREIVTTGIYCSEWCGESNAGRAGTSRG
jgi:hypothetical protein